MLIHTHPHIYTVYIYIYIYYFIYFLNLAVFNITVSQYFTAAVITHAKVYSRERRGGTTGVF